MINGLIMGNSSFTAILNPGEPVETRFKSVHEIPLLTLDRNEETLEKYKGKKLLFVILTPGSVFFENSLKDIHAQKSVLAQRGIQIIGLATNTFEGKGVSFDELKKLNLDFPVYPWVELYL